MPHSDPTKDLPPIVLDADAVREEIHETPGVYELTPHQAARIHALPDQVINAALQAVADDDDDFWTQFDEVRRGAIARLADEPVVPIVTAWGDAYEAAVDAANDLGGSIDAVVEHLAQWDYGVETDDAAAVNGHIQLAELEAWPHQLHEADHGGLHYWLVIDHHVGLYALYRRPLHP